MPDLCDRVLFVLDDDAHRRFIDILDSPPRLCERLRALLHEKAAWDDPDPTSSDAPKCSKSI